jgi:hypothetical protein
MDAYGKVHLLFQSLVLSPYLFIGVVTYISSLLTLAGTNLLNVDGLQPNKAAHVVYNS